MRWGIALLLAGIMLAPASARADDVVKKELALLQGTWVIVGKEFRGKKATPEEIKQLAGETVVKDDKKTEWKEDEGKKEIISEATLKLDPKTTPKKLDVSFTSGVLKGETILGIYEIMGDTVRVCYSVEDRQRPTEFAGKADGKAVLLTYKRVKK